MEKTLIALPNPQLRKPSKKIGYIDEAVEQLVQHMKAITLEWEANREHEVGVALAAIQIDIPLRVIVVRNDFDKYEGDLIEDFEGCLSVKDLYGKVPRYSKVRIKALDLTGKEIRFSAEGFLARVFQHEIDHTNGKVFIDHIKKSPSAFYALNKDGNLQQLDYDSEIKDNRDLWGE
jgi:peptide deformylase